LTENRLLSEEGRCSMT